VIGVLLSRVGDPCADTNEVNKLLVIKKYSDRRQVAIMAFVGIF
jgi:hypothetical protein